MAKGVKKIKWIGNSGALGNFSRADEILCIKPNQTAPFIVGEWYNETTEEEKRKNITWLWMDQKKNTVFNKTIKPAGVAYEVNLPKKLCGSYAFYLEASLYGGHDHRNTGLHVYGKCEEKITASSWSKIKGTADTSEINYGHDLFITLETEGVNGDTLTLELYSEKKPTPSIQTVKTKCINGKILDEKFTTMPCFTAIPGLPDDLEKFYIKVLDITGKYITNASGNDKALSFTIKNKRVMPVFEAPSNNTPLKNGEVDKDPKEEEKKAENTVCVCKDYDLIWGNKESCEFRKKVVEICKELWGENRKTEMANGLMAVMNVETGGSFKGHQIMGKPLQDINTIVKDDFFMNHKTSSRAVGLIQFTQAALVQIGEFTNGSGFDKLHEVKLKLAKVGEVKQLEYVKKYFEDAKNKIKSPEDIYLQVFAPSGVGKSDDFSLYERGNDKYFQNKSVDEENNNDGKIQRSEILGRYNTSFNDGKNNKSSAFNCSTITNSVDAKGIVTYHIYYDGKIERHIPKVIEDNYKNKYKYVYHDSDSIIHDVCIVDWHETNEKSKGTKPISIPTHSVIISDEQVTEGQTTRRVKYQNGDIAEYGSNNGSNFWVLYTATGNKVKLVKMPDELNISESKCIIKYTFSDTQRRYTGGDYLAVFIGVLAECGFNNIVTTGSCFKEASCFPSVAHVNGQSIDTKYLAHDEEQKLINAFNKFGMIQQLVGVGMSYNHTSDGGALHNSHLHSGGISADKVVVIEEK